MPKLEMGEYELKQRYDDQYNDRIYRIDGNSNSESGSYTVYFFNKKGIEQKAQITAVYSLYKKWRDERMVKYLSLIHEKYKEKDRGGMMDAIHEYEKEWPNAKYNDEGIQMYKNSTLLKLAHWQSIWEEAEMAEAGGE